MSKVIVIGSGFAGLATAIRLQAGGHRVRIIEKRPKIGGRSYQLIDRDYVFDMGPSLITAPDLIDAVFASAGKRTEEYVTIVPLDPYYRIYFDDGRHFEYTGDQARMEAEIARFNPADVDGYRRFMVGTQEIYERAFADLAHQPFLRRADFAQILPELVRLKAIRSVYGYVASYISDPHLRMVFSFHPLFLGGNPFRASSIYAIIPYLERLGGVHFAMGGMYSLIKGFGRLFTELGGTITTDACGRRDPDHGWARARRPHRRWTGVCGGHRRLQRRRRQHLPGADRAGMATALDRSPARAAALLDEQLPPLPRPRSPL